MGISPKRKIQLRPMWPGSRSSRPKFSAPLGTVIRISGRNSWLMPSGSIARAQTASGLAFNSEETDISARRLIR